jgi:hypothetical protein
MRPESRSRCKVKSSGHLSYTVFRDLDKNRQVRFCGAKTQHNPRAEVDHVIQKERRKSAFTTKQCGSVVHFIRTPNLFEAAEVLPKAYIVQTGRNAPVFLHHSLEARP